MLDSNLDHSPFHSADAPYTKSENKTRPNDAHSFEPVSLNTAKAKKKFELELQPVIQQITNKASRETQTESDLFNSENQPLEFQNLD